MAEETEDLTPSLTKGEDSTIPRMRLSQVSYNGLNVFSGNIFEECSHELRWPHCMQTYKNMAKDATIAPALNLVEMAIARVPWHIRIPEGYEDQLKDKATFIKQCINDMDHSWGSFIRQVVSFNRYGFAAHEKVYRKRYKKNGSKYNDGLVGIASLPPITQDSIESWDWTDTGRKLTGLYQYPNVPAGKNKVDIFDKGIEQWIRREKFLLFRNNPLKDSPIGESPLNGCWQAWKYKTELEKFEGTGVASDVRGLKVLKLNPRYMAEDASDLDKQTFEYWKNVMRNLHMGEQSGVIVPSLKDENGEEMIADLELLGINGSRSYNVSEIIGRYRSEIITSLMASQLTLGQNGGGSFSLAESLQGISNMAIEAKLIEIQDQLNHDLIKQLFELNGWSTEVMPEFYFGDLVSPDLDVLSKFLQRAGAQGLISANAETANWVAEQANMPKPFPDTTIPTEDVRKEMTAYSSNSGEGMEEGMPSGTGDATGGGDQSTGNGENT
ncbi:portal protein [Pseudomonas phage vB_PsaM_M1]|nr:portal protein [Pseudomonas phage vB_PsaM_M1]